MLEGLDNFDWSKVSHAYGAALDVPRNIRSLVSNVAKERAAALDALYETIWHQGTVYQASIFAVPYILEIARDLQEDRSNLIEFLVALAIGFEVEYLPYDYNPYEMVADWKAKAEKLSSAKLKNSSVGPHIDLQVFSMIQSGVDVFIGGLGSGFTRHRAAGCFALSWFPDVSVSMQLLESRLKDRVATGESEVANTLLSYGFLAFNRRVQVQHSILASYQRDASKIVRAAVAIALACDAQDDWSRKELRTASNDTDLENLYPDILFFDGNLKAYAEAVLDTK